MKRISKEQISLGRGRGDVVLPWWDYGPPEPACLTTSERLEIARTMINRWQQWAAPPPVESATPLVLSTLLQLKPRTRFILQHRIGPKTTRITHKALGRELGITGGRVGNIEAYARQYMKQRLPADVFFAFLRGYSGREVERLQKTYAGALLLMHRVPHGTMQYQLKVDPFWRETGYWSDVFVLMDMPSLSNVFSMRKAGAILGYIAGAWEIHLDQWVQELSEKGVASS